MGWYHGEPVIGVPGASVFQGEWTGGLEGIDKIYTIVEPDEAGEVFWQRLAATELRDRLYRVELEGVKDLRDLHRQDVASFKGRLHDALGRAVGTGSTLPRLRPKSGPERRGPVARSWLAPRISSSGSTIPYGPVVSLASGARL